MTLKFNGEVYRLAQGVDRTRLEADILRAFEKGGDVVRAGLEGKSEVTLLVTPESSVSITVSDVDEHDRFNGPAVNLYDYPYLGDL